MSDGKRVPNFTQPEKLFLMRLISEKYANVIEDKKTNRTSIDEKKEAWKQIENNFNANGPMVCFRSADTLRRLYENKKKELRKKLGEEKKQRLLTGGGTMTPVILNGIDETLISILNEKCLTGLQNNFDCDAEDTVIEPQSGDYEFTFDQAPISQSTPRSTRMVKTTGREFESCNNNNGEFSDGVEFGRDLMTIPCQTPNLGKQGPENKRENQTGVPEWKKFKTDNLKKPVSAALGKQSIDHNDSSATAGSSSGFNRKMKNRRRPMLTRALTSSDISEKYNLLLDRRLALVEKQLAQEEENAKFHKEEHRLKLHLLHLEIEYKKMLLKNNFGVDPNKFNF